MKERPILFSGAMVRALLAGTKTQTRRAVWPQPASDQQLRTVIGSSGFVYVMDNAPLLTYPKVRRVRWDCPYGQPGDRLYVRETWAAPHAYGHLPPRLIPQDARIHYAATEDRGGLLWRPSIHMPRWASRITLEITSVRVERLQEISIEDAKAEGAWGPDDSIVQKVADYFGTDIFSANPRKAFQMLWESINGPDSWAANPWMWAIEFRRLA